MHVRGKKNKTPMDKNVENIWELAHPQLIKYKDHVLYRDTSPKSVKLSERITIGWLLREADDFVEICWDLPFWLQRYEVCDKMSGMKIMKNSIIARYCVK